MNGNFNTVNSFHSLNRTTIYSEDLSYNTRIMNEQQVIKKIGKKNWNKFCEFMTGQTILWKNGEADYFECDVDNFINKMKGLPTFFD